MEEEDAFTTAAAMLSRGGRQWVDRDGEEEEVEDDNGVTVAANGTLVLPASAQTPNAQKR